MKILVIGCGSIGRRHIRLLKEMGIEVTGFEANCERAKEAHEATGVSVYSANEPPPWLHLPLFSGFDGAIIATPNHLHARPAQAVLACGKPVLIEKPITMSVADAEVLLAEAIPPVLIGYCLRYHDHLKRIKQLISEGTLGTIRHASFHFGHDLRQWRPGTDYRVGYAAKRETGGGILLDASHELDLANWFLGEPRKATAMVRNTGALEGLETEDLADVLIEYDSGAQASVHVDYLSSYYTRSCMIIGDKGLANWDLDSKNHSSRLIVDVDGKLTMTTELHNPDDMYRAELAHFVKVIRGEEKPLVTGEDGIRTLLLVEAAKRSSAEGRVIAL